MKRLPADKRRLGSLHGCLLLLSSMTACGCLAGSPAGIRGGDERYYRRDTTTTDSTTSMILATGAASVPLGGLF